MEGLEGLEVLQEQAEGEAREVAQSGSGGSSVLHVACGYDSVYWKAGLGVLGFCLAP